MLTFSYLFQYYWSYTSAPAQVKKALQNAINTREREFSKLLTDTALLTTLENGTVERDEYMELLDKDYFIFIASQRNDGFQTRFWNTQTILPNIELWQRADGIWFEQLINGYYTVYKKEIKLRNGTTFYAMALIPVKWNYFLTTSYLSNSFTYLKGIEKYYTLSDVQKSPLQIRSTDGTGLFWLKAQTNLPQALNRITVFLRLMAMFCFLLLLHKAATSIVAARSFTAGLLFLVAVIVLLRIISYYLPVPLNLRQFELFDPSVYGSNYVLKSLGDLLINSILLLWILLFIRSNVKAEMFLPVRINEKAGLVLTSLLIFFLTILFGNIVKSLVADSAISFSVTNFFSLSVFSFAGFFVLGFLALNYLVDSPPVGDKCLATTRRSTTSTWICRHWMKRCCSAGRLFLRLAR